jgi:hypothetical protein
MSIGDSVFLYCVALFLVSSFTCVYIDVNDVKMTTIRKAQVTGALLLLPLTLAVVGGTCIVFAIMSLPLLSLRLFRKLRAELLSEIEESTK